MLQKNKGGRPSSLESQEKKLNLLIKEIENATHLGLSELARNYEAIMVRAIQEALKGDKQMIKFLLSLPLNLMPQGGKAEAPVPMNSIVEEVITRRTYPGIIEGELGGLETSSTETP